MTAWPSVSTLRLPDKFVVEKRIFIRDDFGFRMPPDRRVFQLDYWTRIEEADGCLFFGRLTLVPAEILSDLVRAKLKNLKLCLKDRIIKHKKHCFYRERIARGL